MHASLAKLGAISATIQASSSIHMHNTEMGLFGIAPRATSMSNLGGALPNFC